MSKKTSLIIAGLLALVVAAGLGVSDAEGHRRDLEAAFATIDVYPAGVQDATISQVKPGSALFGATYTTSDGSREILGFYHRTLTAAGWEFRAHKALRGVQEDCYVKDDKSATVEVNDDPNATDQRLRWTFALDLAWGMLAYCEAHGAQD